MAYMIKKKMLEDVESHFHVIAIQKFGLPHVYCISFSSESWKAAVPESEAVSSIILVEIPGINNQVLLDVTLKHNKHNLCGTFIPSSVLLIDRV